MIKINIDFDIRLIYNNHMNKTILNFISSQNIDIINIEKLKDNHISYAIDINEIISNNKIFKTNNIKKKICITDIKGYNYKFFGLNNYSFIENMSRFFNKEGSGYETRSIGMLDYDTEHIIDELQYSFEREPMNLIEADKNQYIIGDNGLHRLHVLKAHYLKELSCLDKDDESSINHLKEKYTFEARVSELDIFKTYSKFILRQIANFQGKKLDLEAEYDEHWNYTGNVVLKSSDYAFHKNILNDDQLKEFLNNFVTNFLNDKKIRKKEYKQFFNSIENAYKNFDSFKDFFKQNLQQVIPYIKNLNFSEEEKI